MAACCRWAMFWLIVSIGVGCAAIAAWCGR